jgi:hypothetical protein
LLQGRLCDFHNGALPVSASAVKLNGDPIRTPFGKKDYETPRALTVDEIKATFNDYRTAAANAKVSIQGTADLFRRSWVPGATGYCDSLKQSQKWPFGVFVG